MEEKNKSKVWVGKDGIIHVETIKMISEEEILELLEKAKDITKITPLSPNILIVNLITSSVLRSYQTRKQIGEKIKGMVFKKGAICEESAFSRKVALFIIAAIGIKNVEVFDNKQKALKWLKEP